MTLQFDYNQISLEVLFELNTLNEGIQETFNIPDMKIVKQQQINMQNQGSLTLLIIINPKIIDSSENISGKISDKQIQKNDYKNTC